NGQLDVQSAAAGATLKDTSTFTCTVAKGSETPASLAEMKTAVIGPRGEVYLTDGHHTFTSFTEVEGSSVRVRVRIQGNLSNLPAPALGPERERQGGPWLPAPPDNAIEPAPLPASLDLKNFANDPYRGLLYFARDIGYEERAGNANFLEFYWGRWLRAHPTIMLSNYNLADLTSYLALIKAVSMAQVALADGYVVSDGKTAF